MWGEWEFYATWEDLVVVTHVSVECGVDEGFADGSVVVLVEKSVLERSVVGMGDLAVGKESNKGEGKEDSDDVHFLFYLVFIWF